jgi:LysR family nitrogen assimilation transcriptional regulator
MDLKQLKTFLLVAELGSLSKAADRLHIAQPALGRHIKLVEDELGERLFVRHGRGMLLTEAGQLMVKRAAAILRLVEDTRAEISTQRDAVKGTVSLGVPPTAGEVIASRLVERFLRDYPNVVVRIVPAFSGYLLDMLQRGEVDLAIMYETDVARQLQLEPLIKETLFLIGPQKSKLTQKKPIAFRSLADLTMILPGPRHGLRLLLENQARKSGIALQVAVEAEALQTLKELVSRGLGYTVLPLAAVHAELKARTLCTAPIVRPLLSRKLVLARSIVRPSTRAVRIFVDTLKAETSDMVHKGVWEGDLLLR